MTPEDLALMERPMRAQALATTASTPLIVTPRPFACADEVQLRHAPEGFTVAQMLDLMESEGVLDPAVRGLVRVTAGDQVVPSHLWASARPKAGVALFVSVTPRGGSNPLRTLLQIAVVALATFVGAAIGGPWGAMAAAAITVGGTLIINALVPLPQPDGGKARTPRYSLDGASNAAVPHDPVPMVLGRRRIYPRRAANFYTTTIGNTVYLRQLFQPSVSWVEREEPRLGQTALDSFVGVTARWNTKPTDGLALQWFEMTPAEDNLGALPIKQSTGWLTRTAPLECDKLSLDIAVLNGLFNTKESSGAPINRSVTFEVRYGPRGGDPAAATAAPIGVGGEVTWTRADPDSYREEFSWLVARAKYDVHVRRVTADNTNVRVQDELAWVCLRAFRDEPPIRNLAGVPWLELELQGTDQLNGVPNDFNFIATSVVPQATAAGPGAMIATRNPADLFLACSYGPFSDLDLDADERKLQAIADWRALCVTKDWKCDLVEEAETSVGELLQRVAACGRARPTMDFGALSVVVDWEKPLVRQMFTPRTVRNFRGELIYPEDVHGLRVRFQNQDKDFADDTITVFAPGYTEGTATRYDSMEVRDKADPDEVEWEAARVVSERYARPETFTFEQDVEHLVVSEGDRAWLMHHVALIGQVSGRVLAIVQDQDEGVGLRLDEAVVMQQGASYDVAWRPTTPHAVTGLATFKAPLKFKAGERHVVFFQAAPDQLPEVGDLVSVGEHLVETLDVVVHAIRPKPGLMAELVCIPYAPELQLVGTVPITSYRPATSYPPLLPGAYLPARDVVRLDGLARTAQQIARDGWYVADQAFSDGWLTPGEKRTVIATFNAMLEVVAGLRARADALNLTVAAGNAERIAYETAITAWAIFTAGLNTPVGWTDLSDATEILDPAGFSAKMQAWIVAERNLQTAIDGVYDTRIGDIEDALPALVEAVGDGQLSKAEKLTVIPTINSLVFARAALRTQATALNLTVAAGNAERIAFENAATALDNHLATLTTPVAWNNTTDVTVLAAPATFRTVLENAFKTERDLQTKIDATVNGKVDVLTTALSDGVLAQGEKPYLVPAFNALINSRAALRAQADALNLTVAAGNAERIAYENAATALDNHLATLTSPVAWNSYSGDTTVPSPSTFRTAYQDALQSERNLQSKVDGSVNTKVDDLSSLVGDGVLAAGEKAYLVPTITALINARAALRASANSLNVTTGTSSERVTYENAATALDSHLATLTSPVAWNSYGGNTTIASPSTFRTVLQDAMQAETNLVAKLDQAAKDRLGPWAIEGTLTPTVINGRTQYLSSSGQIFDYRGTLFGYSIDGVAGRTVNPHTVSVGQIARAAHNVYFPTVVGATAVAVPAVTHSGLADDTNYTDFYRPQYGDSFCPASAIAYLYAASQDGYMFVGEARTPTGAGTYNPPPGYDASFTGSYEYCVCADAFLASGQRAGDAAIGDPLTLMTPDGDRMRPGEVSAITLAEAPCLTFETDGGAVLTLSESTPVMTRKAAGFMPYAVRASLCEAGMSVPVLTEAGELEWQAVTRITPAGSRPIARISAAGVGIYAASDGPSGPRIFTHNRYQKP